MHREKNLCQSKRSDLYSTKSFRFRPITLFRARLFGQNFFLSSSTQQVHQRKRRRAPEALVTLSHVRSQNNERARAPARCFWILRCTMHDRAKIPIAPAHSKLSLWWALKDVIISTSQSRRLFLFQNWNFTYLTLESGEEEKFFYSLWRVNNWWYLKRDLFRVHIGYDLLWSNQSDEDTLIL